MLVNIIKIIRIFNVPDLLQSYNLAIIILFTANTCFQS